MAAIRPFAAGDAATKNITVGAASANVLVCNRNGPVSVRVMNNGTATVWIRGGGSTVAATAAAGIPIGPGQFDILTFSPSQGGDLYIAAIAAAATGIIYFTPGEGI